MRRASERLECQRTTMLAADIVAFLDEQEQHLMRREIQVPLWRIHLGRNRASRLDPANVRY